MSGEAAPERNAQGNTVTRRFLADADRYLFDFRVCPAADGWRQYDTTQDASYFGVWVHAGKRQTVTFAEGDVIIVTCPTAESYQAQLAEMAALYGPPPPIAVAFDADGRRTEYYDTRPTGQEETPS